MGYEVLFAEIHRFLPDDLGAPFVAVLLLELQRLLFDQVVDLEGIGQQVFQVGDLLDDLSVLVLDLLALQASQAAQLHVQHCLGLAVAQAEGSLHQPLLGLFRRLRAADGLNDLVHMIQRHQQPLEDMLSLLSLLQIEQGAAADHLPPMVDETVQNPLEADGSGLAVHQGQHVDGEGRLHRRVLVEAVQYLAGLPLPLELDDDADAVAVRLVPQVGDAVDAAPLGQRRDLLHQGGLVDLIGQLRDDDLLPAALGHLLGVRAGPHDDAPLALVGSLDGILLLVQRALAALAVAGLLPHPLVAEDDTGGGEIGPLDDLRQVVGRGIRLVDEIGDGVADLAQVVGRDVGGHAHRDTRRTVDQQVGQPRGQYLWLLEGVIEVGDEVHRVAVDVGQRLLGNGSQASLGVAHGRWGVVVHAAEVALAVDQGEAQGEVLRQPHHRFVHGGVAVRVVLAQHLAHNAGALLVVRARPQAQFGHGVEDAPLHRLETVADVGQRPRHDDAHGIVEVGGTHLLLDLYGADVSGRCLYNHDLPTRSGGRRSVAGGGPACAGSAPPCPGYSSAQRGSPSGS